jgi:circadian clock protein KaiB
MGKPEAKKKGYSLKLFVAGDEPHSRRAKSNIQSICRLLKSPCDVETVDVLESYQAALTHNVFLTPALIVLSPGPPVTILGDLSNQEEVLEAIRLRGE